MYHALRSDQPVTLERIAEVEKHAVAIWRTGILDKVVAYAYQERTALPGWNSNATTYQHRRHESVEFITGIAVAVFTRPPCIIVFGLHLQVEEPHREGPCKQGQAGVS